MNHLTLVRQARKHLKEMDERDQDLFLIRLERYRDDFLAGLKEVYGRHPRYQSFLKRLIATMAGRYLQRPPDLKRLDLKRLVRPDWFQQPEAIGYVCYVDRFAGRLDQIPHHLDYLQELGVTYLHLMPLLKPRRGASDGGYAVQDYTKVKPSLGTMDDLEDLARQLRRRGISLCIDLVLNHVAREHQWAAKARRGVKKYRDFFYLMEGRSQVERWEASLPEVFPDFAPGNFTWEPKLKSWVWTTFNDYQWDVNWSNPEVFLAYADLLLGLANRGVEVLRLDAIAFIWKRLGSDCQNQPEVHWLTQSLRSLARIVAPAVVFKAEAIIAPELLIQYLGKKAHFGKVSDLAYHNSLMVQYWSSLAARDTRVMTEALRRFPQKPPSTAWGTYIRCHDDIGWAVSDADARAAGWDGPSHRKFLAEYYAGDFPTSCATGDYFQVNPRTGDARSSGSTASLNGLEQALEEKDETLTSQAIQRILLGHALILGYSGVPLLYMGDEIGLLNDHDYRRRKGHADDNRWMHRPFMDWEKAGRRHDGESIEGRLFQGTCRLIEARKRLPHLHAAIATEAVDCGNRHVFACLRRHPLGPLLQLYNFTEYNQFVRAEVPRDFDIQSPYDRIALEAVDIRSGYVFLPPYAVFWLTHGQE
ncbi:MAG TPA: alpha-amylase family protein [Acidobacteriota bacterium]|nr:alpha-amylase family protein [Acidobacteriota bacterium]